MWECEHCGTTAIAADLVVCPHCGKEREMPKITAEGGGSNASEEAPAEVTPEDAPAEVTLEDAGAADEQDAVTVQDEAAPPPDAPPDVPPDAPPPEA